LTNVKPDIQHILAEKNGSREKQIKDIARVLATAKKIYASMKKNKKRTATKKPLDSKTPKKKKPKKLSKKALAAQAAAKAATKAAAKIAAKAKAKANATAKATAKAAAKAKAKAKAATKGKGGVKMEPTTPAMASPANVPARTSPPATATLPPVFSAPSVNTPLHVNTGPGGTPFSNFSMPSSGNSGNSGNSWNSTGNNRNAAASPQHPVTSPSVMLRTPTPTVTSDTVVVVVGKTQKM
jgi:hypothetical protein